MDCGENGKYWWTVLLVLVIGIGAYLFYDHEMKAIAKPAVVAEKEWHNMQRAGGDARYRKHWLDEKYTQDY